MLKNLVKHRAKNVLAIYVEPGRVEAVRAHRKWRKWRLDPPQSFPIPEGDLYDVLHLDILQRPYFKARGKGTALILFLPLSYYLFNRELYPAIFGEQLDEALAFDWQENLFYEPERTCHFAGAAVRVDNNLSVPVFSMQKEIFDKFEQALGGDSFQSFAILPSAVMYESLFSLRSFQEESSSALKILGRVVDPLQLEIHRFYKGALLDSVLIGKDQVGYNLFRESLLCLGEGESEPAVVNLICLQEECDEKEADDWVKETFSVDVRPLDDFLIAHWLRSLLAKDEVKTFTEPLLLKPWEVPKAAYLVLTILALYSAFAWSQARSYDRLMEQYQRLKKQTTALEAQWKPIEQLQTKIAKFQEDQKTLSQFNLEGYPLFEILTLLTQITPDDTWLNYFSVRKGQLILRGESKSAIKYLPELSKVEGFGDVRFASPVTRNPASDQERFNVQLQFDPEKFKKTISAMALDKEQEKAPPDMPEEVAPPPVSPPAPGAGAVVAPGPGGPEKAEDMEEDEESDDSEDAEEPEEEGR